MEKENKDHDGGNSILHFIINEKKYQWHKQYITGAEVRKIASIHEDDEIFLKIRDPWKDEPIQDDSNIDLARPGIEHFFSKEVIKDVVIIVNGSPKKWSKRQITFREVIELAYGTYNDHPDTVYTVAYEDGPKQNPEGSLLKGNAVFVKDKMIFHATCTDKS